MRHTDIRTTQRYYHGDTVRLRDLVNRRGRIIDLEKQKLNRSGIAEEKNEE